MFSKFYPSTVVLGVLAVLLVATVSLTAGFVVGSIVHPTEVAFAERWPARQIVAADPATSEAITRRFRG